MSMFSFRGTALPGLLAAGLGSAFLTGPASAQDEGDKVVLVLTNGKKFTGTFVSRDGANVKIKMGASEIALPASFVATVEKVDTGEPAPSPTPEPRRPAAADPETPSNGGGARSTAPASSSDSESRDEPKGTTVVLKDGTVIEGFVVFKAGGRLWIVPGEPVTVDESDIEEAYGQTEPPSGGGKGIAITGDAGKDAACMIEELASGEKSRMLAARAVLEGLGKAAIPALIGGLKHSKPTAREQCISRLFELGADEAVDPIMAVLRNDTDAGVRAMAAARLGTWDPPGARRVILEAVWRDRSDEVKSSGLMGLEKTAGPEEASALIDLLAILPNESKAFPTLYRVLRKATGERFGDTTSLWNAWWDAGGRDKMAQFAERLAARRQRQEEAARFGTTVVEEEPKASEGSAPPAGEPGTPPPPPMPPPQPSPPPPENSPR